MFYSGIIKSKGYHSEDDWSEDFKNAIDEWRFESMGQLEPLVVDKIFERVKRIEIEEIPFEQVKQKEKEKILELKPPFNYETRSDEYFEVSNMLN